MSRWWRAYSDSMDDPKLMLLSADLFRSWYILLCVASKNDGRIPSASHAALALRVNESKAKATVAVLASKGLFDAVAGGYFEPHNWNARQYKSDVSTNRVKQFRERHRNGGETFHEAEKKRPQITETESERKKETRASALGSDWPPDFAEQFWGAFPNKVGRKAAIDKLERIGKTRRVSFEELMAGLHGYVTKTDDRPWCNPLTWLNQERWTDQPAAQNGVKNGHIHQNGSLLEAADQLVERARQRLAEARGENHVFDAESAAFAGSISPGGGE